ncbi:MAG: hypothetical protein A2Y40_10715 [Candidatus Margulisbacteria bacterium GWF2_35_9]|nr:MAG: hypothetical protein A2Y40_10715 [Candidatus Margulisbacteria bacterium GWF2_35_9]
MYNKIINTKNNNKPQNTLFIFYQRTRMLEAEIISRIKTIIDRKEKGENDSGTMKDLYRALTEVNYLQKKFQIPYYFYQGEMDVKINSGLQRANVLDDHTRHDRNSTALDFQRNFGSVISAKILNILNIISEKFNVKDRDIILQHLGSTDITSINDLIPETFSYDDNKTLKPEQIKNSNRSKQVKLSTIFRNNLTVDDLNGFINFFNKNPEAVLSLFYSVALYKANTTNDINTGFAISMYDKGQVNAITLDELFNLVAENTDLFNRFEDSISQTETVHLRKVDKTYYQIIKHLDSPVDTIMISDPHGASNKVLEALSIFPNAKVLYGGDAFDRAVDAHGTINLLKTFDTREMLTNPDGVIVPGKQVKNQHYQGVDGNHDFMMQGFGLGEETAMCHAFRFMLRYNEADYLENKIGIDLSKAKEQAIKKFREGNYKAKHPDTKSGEVDINKALEAYFTDLQLSLTYGDDSVQLSSDEQALLHNLKFKEDKKQINDPKLVVLYQKILNGNKLASSYKANMKKAKADGVTYIKNKEEMDCTLTPAEVEIINRCKKGNHQRSAEDNTILRDLQMQVIQSKEVQSIVEFCMFHNSSYNLESITADDGRVSNFFQLHSHIPLNKDGSFKTVSIPGYEGQYKGIALLDKMDEIKKEYYEKYKTIDKTNKQEIEAFLEWVNQKRTFNWLAWDFDSPAYGRIMQTFERAYLPELSETYEEPKDYWYQIFQTSKANPDIVEYVFKQIADDLGVDKNTLKVVNGHTPNQKGFMDIWHEGRLIRIDAGASPSYGDHGIVTLITKKGSIFCLSLSNDPTQKFKMYQVINGKLVDVTKKDNGESEKEGTVIDDTPLKKQLLTTLNAVLESKQN